MNITTTGRARRSCASRENLTLPMLVLHNYNLRTFLTSIFSPIIYITFTPVTIFIQYILQSHNIMLHRYRVSINGTQDPNDENNIIGKK